MPCWVAPSIAAELWGISLEQVMSRAKNGEIVSSTQLGFFVIDLEPEVQVQANAESPPTFTQIDETVSPVELAALTHDWPNEARDRPMPSHDLADEEPAVIEDWREVRRRMSRMRIPPGPQKPPSRTDAHAA